MALISKQEKNDSENMKILISHQVKEEVMAYCQWATIEDFSYFFNEAAKIVFAKDKDWIHYKQHSKNIG